ASSRIDPSTTRAPKIRAYSKLASSPVEKSSSTVTCSPWARSASTRWLPMKPAPPVTRIRDMECPADQAPYSAQEAWSDNVQSRRVRASRELPPHLTTAVDECV